MLSSVVISHGGWKDWETFCEHYPGEFSLDVYCIYLKIGIQT